MFLTGFTFIQKTTQLIYLLDSNRFAIFKVIAYGDHVQIFCFKRLFWVAIYRATYPAHFSGQGWKIKKIHSKKISYTFSKKKAFLIFCEVELSSPTIKKISYT